MYEEEVSEPVVGAAVAERAGDPRATRVIAERAAVVVLRMWPHLVRSARVGREEVIPRLGRSVRQ
jgi:hypothetical protein